MSYADQLKQLSKNEVTVLFWKCKGLKYNEIASKFKYSQEWVQLQMSTAYSKLGFDPKMHWTKRVKILEDEVCPLLPENIEDWVPNEESPQEPEPQPEPDPEMMSMVKIDEERPATMEVVEGEIVRPRNNAWGCTCVVLVFVCVLLGGGGYFGYRFIVNRGTPTPTTAVVPQNTPLPSAIPDVATTQAPQATSEPPTVAATSTIPAPTSTPPAFYDQGVYAPLENGYIKLDEAFNDEHLACTPPDPGFEVSFTFQTSQPIFLRYDPTGFSATDDTGNTYDLKGAGITICNAVGPQALQVYYGQELRLKFAGVIPQTATDIVITAQLNGRKFVFHKSL